MPCCEANISRQQLPTRQWLISSAYFRMLLTLSKGLLMPSSIYQAAVSKQQELKKSLAPHQTSRWAISLHKRLHTCCTKSGLNFRHVLPRHARSRCTVFATHACVSAQVDVRENVISVIAEVFALHGAVRMSSYAVGTVSKAADAPAGMAVVLTQTGNRLALRYEMRRPFCNWLVRQAQRASQSALLFLKQPINAV